MDDVSYGIWNKYKAFLIANKFLICIDNSVISRYIKGAFCFDVLQEIHCYGNCSFKNTSNLAETQLVLANHNLETPKHVGGSVEIASLINY